jgi:hypothetical protein
MQKEFNIRDLLSITTGRLISDKHIADVYEVMDFMTDNNFYTHELPDSSISCRKIILKQFPELEKAEAPEDLNYLFNLINSFEEDLKDIKKEDKYMFLQDNAVLIWIEYIKTKYNLEKNYILKFKEDIKIT